MYRFNHITMLAPLFSVLPLSAWLMLLGSTLVGMIMRPSSTPAPDRIAHL
jgi:hypothetical protein